MKAATHSTPGALVALLLLFAAGALAVKPQQYAPCRCPGGGVGSALVQGTPSACSCSAADPSVTTAEELSRLSPQQLGEEIAKCKQAQAHLREQVRYAEGAREQQLGSLNKTLDRHTDGKDKMVEMYRETINKTVKEMNELEKELAVYVKELKDERAKGVVVTRLRYDLTKETHAMLARLVGCPQKCQEPLMLFKRHATLLMSSSRIRGEPLLDVQACEAENVKLNGELQDVEAETRQGTVSALNGISTEKARMAREQKTWERRSYTAKRRREYTRSQVGVYRQLVDGTRSQNEMQTRQNAVVADEIAKGKSAMESCGC